MIFWGTKHTTRNLGYVADFCPICRAPKPFQLTRIGLASHLYFISFGKGRLVGYDRTCQDCGTSYSADPTMYESVVKKSAPVEELIRQTFPNLFQTYKDRLALEKVIKTSAALIPADQRYALIRDPFWLLSPKVEKRFASTQLDKEILFAMVAAIVLVVIGPSMAEAIMPKYAGESLLACLGLGLLLIVWQMAAAGRRFMKRQVIPVLATCLQPLKPTESELTRVLAELKQLGHKMGKRLKLEDLQTQMMRSPGK